MAFPCGREAPAPVSRRDMLRRFSLGLGSVAMTSLLHEQGRAADPTDHESQLNPFAVRQPHFRGSARSVIFLYMDGGPSQVDTFDHKPILAKHAGRAPGEIFTVEPTQFDNVGKLTPSPWEFKRRGESGLWMSELLPHLAGQADRLCMIHSMTSRFPEHTSANYFLHTGSGLQGRPSMGAWLTYGLGSFNRDLPGFVVLNSGLIPPGGLDNFNSGFLPAAFQGSIFRPSNPPVSNIARTEPAAALQRAKLDFVRGLDRAAMDRMGEVDALESAIANAELAYRMQSAVPDLTDLSGETQATREAYGLESATPGTRVYGQSCLIARRLVERGVRFIEVTCPKATGDRWDQHDNLRQGHEANARNVDQPIAALLQDLAQRGLLDSTLVVWAGEFGRTPFAQGSNGRDHNPQGFTVWMAGGGVKGGMSFGATDEFGYKAVENRLEIHDLHATLLHILGVDHTRQTFRWSGRDMRLTDVHGHVVHDILEQPGQRGPALA